MKTLKLAFLGDVMLGRLVNEYINAHDYKYPLGNTIKILKQANLVIANLECCIAENGFPWNKTPKAFFFRANPEAINTLKHGNMDYVSLANNHTLDFQEPALLETLERLNKANIKYAGAGKNLEDAEKICFIKKKNYKIAIISCADHPYEFKASNLNPGIFYINPLKDFNKVKNKIKEAKKKADLVIFSIHIGPNMVEKPFQEIIEFAHKIIEAGADIYHGHSAHIFQGIEIYKNKLIMYDCGDFVDDYYVGPEEKNDQQLIFFITLQDKKIKEIKLFPLFIDNCQVNLAKNKIYEEIYERIKKLSLDFNTNVIKAKDYLKVKI